LALDFGQCRTVEEAGKDSPEAEKVVDFLLVRNSRDVLNVDCVGHDENMIRNGFVGMFDR
jgi:hypothetical protein